MFHADIIFYRKYSIWKRIFLFSYMHSRGLKLDKIFSVIQIFLHPQILDFQK